MVPVFTAQRVVRSLFAVAATFLIAAAARYAIVSSLHARANAQCEDNLQKVAQALHHYAYGAWYPKLSPQPGELMFRAESVYPSYLIDTTCLISPSNPHAEEMHRMALSQATSAIDDSSYWYLGYLFANERSALEWIEEYRQHIPNGEPIPLHPGIWPEYEDDIAARQRAGDVEWHKSHPDGKPVPPEKGRGPPGNAASIGPRLQELRVYMPLGEGAERFLQTDIGTPPDVQIPVMVERPELHGDGGHVLYLDGHVEFVPYPGKFPMTPAFIEALRSLDSLTK